jgi:vacuolar-type H+-ATPase subunit I/STV1
LKILAEISVGELYDKITILNIKLKKINDPNKLKNIKIELDALSEQSNKIILKDNEILKEYIQKLQDINEELWDIENTKRECEANKEFGDTFIKISRDVHFKNDIRASIKKEINLLSDSKITEEKEYSKY